MRTTIKKLYKGKVDLRDYDVENCIKKNENIEVIHNYDKMTLSPEDLLEKRVGISPVFGSKMGGKSYRLYSYEWKPNKSEL